MAKRLCDSTPITVFERQILARPHTDTPLSIWGEASRRNPWTDKGNRIVLVAVRGGMVTFQHDAITVGKQTGLPCEHGWAGYANSSWLAGVRWCFMPENRVDYDLADLRKAGYQIKIVRVAGLDGS